MNIYDAEGATNVQWVWDPQAAAFCSGHAQSYYPGDAYVDWIAGTAIPPSAAERDRASAAAPQGPARHPEAPPGEVAEGEIDGPFRRRIARHLV